MHMFICCLSLNNLINDCACNIISEQPLDTKCSFFEFPHCSVTFFTKRLHSKVNVRLFTQTQEAYHILHKASISKW